MADHDIAAAPEAMRDEARGWDELADSMIRAHASVAHLSLRAEAFSVVDAGSGSGAGNGGALARAGEGGAGAAAAFAGSRDRLAGLLRQAGAEFDRMASALRVAADRYDEDDRAAADRMRGVW